MPALVFQVRGDLLHPPPVSFHRSTPWNIASAAATARDDTAGAAIPRGMSMTCDRSPVAAAQPAAVCRSRGRQHGKFAAPGGGTRRRRGRQRRCRRNSRSAM